MRRILQLLLLCLTASTVVYGMGWLSFDKPASGDRPPPKPAEKSLAVETAAVRRSVMQNRVNAVGSLMANRYVSVAPKISGRVESIAVQVGDRVDKGQVVARLDPRELREDVNEATASLEVAEATLKGKQAELLDLRRKVDRAKRLFGENFISRQELDTLESEQAAAAAQVELTRAQIVQMRARLAAARLQLSETNLTAPFAGFVEKRLVDPGAMVGAGTPIASIVDIARVKVLIPVVESDYPRISPGQEAAVTVDAYPERRFQGRVARLPPVLDQETRTGEVEIEVRNPDGLLKPGMFARVGIAIDAQRSVLSVPNGALVKTPEGHGVYRVGSRPSGKAEVELLAVELGASRDGRTEVRGGLSAGDRVVTVGANLLQDGQSVSVPAAGGAREDNPRSHDES